MSRKFDVVVIGAGPGGYIAAIRAAQHGMSVACIDEWQNRDGKYAFGGTCLNAGCIPSKAMLESSELYHRAEHEFTKHGIKTGKLDLDIAAMQKRGLNVVEVDAATQAEWEKLVEDAYPRIRGSVIPADAFDEARQHLADYRSSGSE